MFYAPRDIDAELIAWSSQPGRKPLVLRGARQVGKTASVRHLAQSFDHYVELNLERPADRRLVDTCASAAELLTALAIRLDLRALPPRTLLFVDEIQERPEAVAWLRFFYEDHPELAVVAAGSLMEVRLQERDFSFPVGRVTFRYLHPLTFLEFLSATGRRRLAEQLVESATTLTPVAAPLHDEARERLRDYLLVGGMPEAVVSWAQQGSPVDVRQVHGDLVQGFAEDLHKYAGVRDMAPLEAAFHGLRHHYGQRFKYEGFAPGFASRPMKTALGRLEGAMVVRQLLPTTSTRPPPVTRARAAHKLLPLDIGIALSDIGVPWSELRAAQLDRVLDGRVAEILVGQELVAGQTRRADPLHFWVSESSRGSAEVDYLLPQHGKLLPVEVKAGATGTLKSLHRFLQRADHRTGIRLYDGALRDDQNEVRMDGTELAYRLVSLPLYLAAALRSLPDLTA